MPSKVLSPYKTKICSFFEVKIFPGRGQTIVIGMCYEMNWDSSFSKVTGCELDD
jgi:hypothetical protein